VEAAGEPVREIRGAALRRSLRCNVVAGALGTIWFNLAYGMPLMLFFEALGASGKVMGLSTTARCAAMLVQLPAALWAERLRTRKSIWAPLAIAHRLVWFGVGAVAFAAMPGEAWAAWWVIGLLVVSDLIGQAAAPAWFSWMSDLVPTRVSGRFWGRRQGIITGVSLAGMALAGGMLDAFRDPGTGKVGLDGFGWVFALAAFVGTADIIVHLGVAEPAKRGTASAAGWWGRIWAPLRERNFRILTASMALWAAGGSMIAGFQFVHLKRAYGFSYFEISTVTIAAALGTAVLSRTFGRWVDRVGPRTFCVLLFGAAPLTGLSWFLMTPDRYRVGPFDVSQALVVQGATAFVAGGLFMAVGIAQMRLLAEWAPRSGRTMAMAVHWAATGLVMSAGPLAAGAIMDAIEPLGWTWRFPWGTRLSFFHVEVAAFAAVVWGLALPAMIALPRGRSDLRWRDAVRWLLWRGR
jgi:MFS family permease